MRITVALLADPSTPKAHSMLAHACRAGGRPDANCDMHATSARYTRPCAACLDLYTQLGPTNSCNAMQCNARQKSGDQCKVYTGLFIATRAR